MNHPNSNKTKTLRIVFWETTVRCNLTCGHCRRLSVRPEGELTTKEARGLIDDLGTISQSQKEPVVLIFSGGEPLLRKDLFDLAAAARQNHLHLALATNGTLINPPTAKQIADTGFGRVAVSLDGPTAEIHDRLRRLPGCFQDSVRGISHCRQAGLPVQINTTISRTNIQHLDAMLARALELKAVAWHVFIFVPVGCGSELPADEMLSATEAEDVLQWLYQASLKHPIQIKPTCAPQYYRILAAHRAMAPGTVWHRYTRGCLAGINVCFVSSTGKIFPCGYLPAEAGDIRIEKFPTIWTNSELFGQLRDYTQLKGNCGGCSFVECCGGCRARAFSVCGDYLAGDPGCRLG